MARIITLALLVALCGWLIGKSAFRLLFVHSVVLSVIPAVLEVSQWRTHIDNKVAAALVNTRVV